MALSKSPTSLEQRVAENQEIKAEKKRQKRLEQKRQNEANRRARLKAAEEEQSEEQRLQLKRERALLDSDVWRQRPPGYLWLGEVAPGKDATSLSEVDAVCERWLRALGLTHEKETLAQREERIFYASQAIGHPYLSVTTGELIDADNEPWRPEPSDGKKFADVWMLLPGADRTMASMPDLSGLPKANDEDSKPQFKFTLAPKKPKPADAIEGVPDSTGNSIEAAGAPAGTYSDTATGGMTFRQEQELAARQELEREQQECLRAATQLQDAPVALFSSQIGSTN